MINICFSLYDKTGNYSKFLGTTMLSLLDNLNTPPPRSVTVHILHDRTLTKENQDNFSYIAGLYNQLVKFYNVEELCADKIAAMNKLFENARGRRFSEAMFYRFFIPYLIPTEKKAIYLDADIIVNLDINELWQIELGDRPLGAIPNFFQVKDEQASIERTNRLIEVCRDGIIKSEDYFNSGVLLMNLSFWRNDEEILMRGMEFFKDRPSIQLPDQDILNCCFSTSFLKLPVKFNRYVMLARQENELTIEPKIYHYAGGKEGLGLDIGDPFNRLWLSYFIKTPWFNIDTVGNMLKNIDELDTARENSIWQLCSVTAGKTRAFVVDEENADRLEKHFAVRDEEEVFIIDPENAGTFSELIDLMDAAQDNKIFLLGIPYVASILTKSGFVEGTNFIDVSDFYSPAWKVPANSYDLAVNL